MYFKSRTIFFIYFLVASLFFFSCAKDERLKETVYDSTTKLKSSLGNFSEDEIAYYKGGFSTWQEQLDNLIKNGGHLDILGKNGLTLESYQLTNDKFLYSDKDSLLSSNKVLVSTNPYSIDSNFVITPIAKADSLIQKQILRKRNILERFLNKELSLIKLVWSYKGTSIVTNSVVCNEYNAVIYDDFLSNIVYSQVIDDNEDLNIENVILNQLPIKKTFSEAGPETTIEYQFRTATYVSTNWLNQVSATAYAGINIYGKKSSSGEKSLVRFEAVAYHDAKPGFSADAKCEVPSGSFTAGANGSCTFGYAAMTAGSGGLTISGGGLSMTIPPGSHGTNGQKYIVPSQLN